MSDQQRWGARLWSVEFERDRVILRSQSKRQDFRGTDVERIDVVRHWLRWRVTVDGVAQLKGLGKGDAIAIRYKLKTFLREQKRLADQKQRQVRRADIRRLVDAELQDLLAWHTDLTSYFAHAEEELRWIPYDQVKIRQGALPDLPVVRRHRTDPEFQAILTAAESEALRAVDVTLEPERRRRNKLIEKLELQSQQHLLQTIEKRPLTDEQARAVIRFDNRVQVIAAAGSGKTSVMVARAAYAIKRGFVPADRILLLAFNANAATELQERVDARLATHGIDTTGLKAATFHSFGLSLIGQATGEKPRLAPWLETGQDIKMIERIVDELRDSSLSFRYRWDLYRLLFARTAATEGGNDPDWWDPQTKVSGHRTFGGETVRSQGEKLIADWLYLSGVEYEYERAYSFPVADSEHAQYRPDFYYPDIDVWHEHWAVGRDGKAIEEFDGYSDGMEWKRRTHLENSTTLIETTWAEIIDESGLEPLEEQLRHLGLEIDWNPDRPIPGAEPVKHEELAKVMRSFMSHVKANSLDREAVNQRLTASAKGLAKYRSELFVELYWDIHDSWEERLRAERFVDFEDMLVQAAEALETSAATAAYDLILVDEFQDSSAARARLVKALIQGNDKYLLTVGDDWQSIYRFAGSDVSIMTNFKKWFGPCETLHLQTTFRSTQVIADAASTFVSQNPRQLAKKVKSAQGPGGAPIVLASVTAANPNRPEPELTAAVHGYLNHVSQRLQEGVIEPGRDGKVTVDILGRYRFEQALLPAQIPKGLTVHFRTIHRAKGLEADYVLLPRVIRGNVGFPSQIEDDPVLNLVMADPDPFPFGEERRLFYVALTRARREVALVTVKGKESPFVVEMLARGLLTPLTGASNETADVAPSHSAADVCPRCSQGLLVPRTGRYGDFLGCGRFPACKYTQPTTTPGGQNAF